MKVVLNKTFLAQVLGLYSNRIRYVLSNWQPLWVFQTMTADLVQVHNLLRLCNESHQGPDNGSGVGIWNGDLLEQPDVAIRMRRV